MTNIRLIYNPFTKTARIYREHKEITAAENKIYTFLNTDGFYDCLMPFNRRYVVWEGLLPELISEANDEELRVVFEGREADFVRLEKAFDQLRPAVENAGYENRWQLAHARNFEAGDIVLQLQDIARNLREMCESRAELKEIESLTARAGEDNIRECCEAVRAVISGHIAKWEQSGSRYRQEKIVYLEMLEERLDEAAGQAENL